MWTTEWLCYNGVNRSTNALESKTVREVFVSTFGRKLAQGKRKRSDAGNKHPNSETDMVPTDLVSSAQHHVKGDDSVSTLPPIVDQTPPLPETTNVIDSNNPPNEDLPSETAVEPSPEKPKPTPSRLTESLILDPGLYFYLHNPQTPAKYKCLIPISADMSLREVLHGRTLLEFPSFYVRAESPDALPAPFIAQEKYNESHGVDLPIDVLPVYNSKDTTTEVAEGARPSLTEVDEKTVLEVLQKDLTG